ncbi:MAG: DUF2336 domain-containing protein [Parasphingopyxis sp.]|nr:DUF2336 domain-containing protein [Sphingomonadales bacterium]
MSERGQNDANPGGQRDEALRAAAVRLSRRQGERAAAALRELTDPYPLRLSDRQRLAIERISHRLIEEIEDELRGAILADDALPPNDSLEASLGAGHVAIAAPILEQAGLLPDARIVALALERSDMHEAGRRLREGGSPGQRLSGLVGEGSDPQSSAAMALLIAESRANLRFEDPRLPLGDVPADIRESLIWQVAAALRHYAVERHDAPANEIDRSVSGAADRLCADMREESGLLEAAAALAASLDAGDAELLREALEAGRIALYCGLLGSAAEIDIANVWALAGDPDGLGHALLLRAAGIDRDAGASLVMALLGALGDDPAHPGGAPEWLGVWDSLDAAGAGQMLDHWRRAPAYRDALTAIGRGGAS